MENRFPHAQNTHTPFIQMLPEIKTLRLYCFEIETARDLNRLTSDLMTISRNTITTGSSI